MATRMRAESTERYQTRNRKKKNVTPVKEKKYRKSTFSEAESIICRVQWAWCDRRTIVTFDKQSKIEISGLKMNGNWEKN